MHGLSLFALTLVGAPSSVLPPASERFAELASPDTPDFQKHVLPAMSRLGCNGRACHGSFQGRGGFRLSLFGYDFEQDILAIATGEKSRIDLDDPSASLIIQKPTEQVEHEGGMRYELGSWQHHLFLKWIQCGAKGVSEEHKLERIAVEPAEIVFEEAGQSRQLRVVAYWADGAAEDVTCLCRFQTNDPSIAEVDENGLVSARAKGDTHVIAFYDNGVANSAVLFPISKPDPEIYRTISTPTKIDELVLEKWKKLGIVPSPLASDEEFLRRVSLDIAGTLPTAQEVRDFLSDKDPQKRSRKVDALLESPAYSAWWATRFCDFTGNTAQEFNAPFQASFTRQWYEWIRKRIQENVPYDQIMAGIALGRGREEGESFREYAAAMTKAMMDPLGTAFADRSTMQYFWARRNIRKEEEKALMFSHAFLGVRLECAQCHKHPFDQWTQQEFAQFSQFFKGVAYGVEPESRGDVARMLKETGLAGLKGQPERQRILELVKAGTSVPFREVYTGGRPGAGQRKADKQAVKKAQTASRAITPKLLGGEEVVVGQFNDPREAVVEWMCGPENPYFACAIVNRVWAHYFGVGIIDPPDDQNLANPPSNPELLTELVRGFIDSGFDLKWLHRAIANSHTYQRSWVANDTNRNDSRHFSRALLRRLPAEVVVDAIDVATASSERLAKLNDEKLAERGIYRGGYGPINGQAGFALKLFGQSERRTACDCTRTSEPSVVQAVYLQNDLEIQRALDRTDGWIREVAAKYGLQMGNSPPEEDQRPRRRAKDIAVKDEGARGQRGERATKKDTPVNDVMRERQKDVTERIERIQAALDALPADAPKEKRQDLERRRERLKRLEKIGERQASKEAMQAESKLSGKKLSEIVDEVYLRTVSRMPTPKERLTSIQYIKASPSTIDGVRDLAWAMMNTKEFIVNH